MKNMFKYAYSLLAGVVALTSVSCSDKYEYDGRGVWDATDDYANIYFNTTDSVLELDPTEATTATIKVQRKNTKGALEVPFTITKNTDDVFEVGKASFADGANEAEFTLNFPKAVVGTPYTLQLTLNDPTLVSKYSKEIVYTLNLTRVKWNSLGIGTIAEGFYLGYSANVEIQQRDDKPAVFRIIKPLDDILAQDLVDYPEDAPYLNGLQPDKLVFTVLSPGDVVSEDVYGDPVTVKGKDLVDYNTYHLGFTNSSYGEPVKCYHPKSMKSTAAESSWAFNKVLSYQADGKTPGQVQFAPFYYMDGVGGWNNTQKDGIVVITFPGYTPLYTASIKNNDFAWEKVFSGTYMSAQLNKNTPQITLYKGVAKEEIEAENPGCYERFEDQYGTVYKIEGPYAAGYDLFFAVKDGQVVIPEGFESQPLGFQGVGYDIYGVIGAGGSTFADDRIDLKITFQDKSGKVDMGSNIESLVNITFTMDMVTGPFTYYGVIEGKTYNLGNFTSVVDPTAENALVLKDFYLEGSEVAAVADLDAGKMYVGSMEYLGIEEDDGTPYYVFTYSVGDNEDYAGFDINIDGTLTSDELILVASPDLKNLYYWARTSETIFVPLTNAAAKRATAFKGSKKGAKLNVSAKRMAKLRSQVR